MRHRKRDHDDQLDAGAARRFGTADELGIAALRRDGTLRPHTTIWVVRVGDDLYVRSYRRQAGAWYQAVQRRPEGRIRPGGVERDVTFEHPPTPTRTRSTPRTAASTADTAAATSTRWPRPTLGPSPFA